MADGKAAAEWNSPDLDLEQMQTCQQSLNLEFKSLTFAAREKKGGGLKQILKNVSGRFKSGRLTAILGPSGAGKTSLLNVLSGQRTRGVQGCIKSNGEDRVNQDFRKLSCYIPQEFAMLPLLTTKETLTVAANLKLDPQVKLSKKQMMVSEVLEVVGLQKVANTQVMNLSGGEKKRLSVGMELLTNPPVMFFDEPTSGLDSFSSVLVISHLKSLAQGGRTVVCSIHQPSSKLFAMFDEVYILSEGQCLYTGSISNLVTSFRAAGFSCPEFYNRADFVIEVACKERGEVLQGLIEQSHNNFSLERNTFPNNQTEVDSPEVDTTSEECSILLQYVSCRAGGNGTLEFPGSFLPALTVEGPRVPITACQKSCGFNYNVGSWGQFWILLQRSMLCTARDLHLAQLRLAAHILVGLLLGGIYYGMGNDASKVMSNSACLFFFIMFLFFSNAMPAVQAFPSEMAVFLREHYNNWYSVKAYYFARVIADLPLQLVCPTLFLLIGYFMTDQPADIVRLSMLWLVCILITIIGQTLGLVIGAILDEKLGTFLVPATTIPMLLFSGFFMHLKDIHPYLKWLSYASYFRYAFEAALLSIYGGGREDLVCSFEYCYYKSPHKFLVDMGMAESSYSVDVGVLVGTVLLLQATLYVGLRWRIFRLPFFVVLPLHRCCNWFACADEPAIPMKMCDLSKGVCLSQDFIHNSS